MLRLPGSRRAASRFVAGETLDDAARAVRGLNARGLAAALDLLGEKTTSAAGAEAAADAYAGVLRRITADGLQSAASLKLTQLGLEIDEALTGRLVRRLVTQAREIGTFIGIDMESSAYTDRTLALYRGLRADGFDNVEVVLQSYLYRTARDLDALLPLRPRVRLVKGAYAEPPAVAFARKADVDASYRRLARRLLEGPAFPAIATHDPRLITAAIADAQALGRAPEAFEFQMLYGIRRDLQEQLRAQGYRVRVYVPFGTEWFPYFMRRLAERPANVIFLARNVLLEKRQ